ncbi:T9SS type A sorting domain-containing protein [Salmonirosea aquatica]|uniref:T9SS type A sorting domain-containing protein n=1 Tax=Salmonirosea aquatica TaxID=2654236 RepID=UPI003571101F
MIAIETRDDLTNAEVAFYNVNGAIIRTQHFALLNQRRTIDARALPPGLYIVRVRAPGLDVTKRIVID